MISVTTEGQPGALMGAPDVMELLLDISSRLQAMEHYTEVWKQVERGSTQDASAVSAGHGRIAMEWSTAASR